MADLWVCGHKADAMCGGCYRALAERANTLAEENAAFHEVLTRLARGRFDNGRPLGGQLAREACRRVLLLHGYGWSKENA